MKILVCIDHMATGGAARVTSIMCQGLADRGYNVLLAYNKQRNALYDCGPDVKTIDNYVERCGKSHLAGAILFLQRILKYKQIIRHTHPDIIIGVEPEPYLYARLALWCSHIPVIAVDHASYRKRLHWFTHWIRWHAYSWADKVSILSNVDATILGNNIPNKIVIHNPISFDICLTEHARENIVLCVGRLDAWEVKGFDRIIRIWGKIGGSNTNWKLVIAGGGTSASIQYLQQLAKTEANNAKIEFKGEVKDMQALYRQSSIFALSSRIEGFPMCLLEAASQGCACISYTLGGVSQEIYTDARSGIIVDDNNDAEFAKSLNNLIQNPALRQFYSKAIRKEIERFSKNHFINTWEQLCQTLQKY